LRRKNTDKKIITFQQFIDGYKRGEFEVHVVKSKAGDFVLSKLGDKYNKPAHYFWTWLGIIMVVPLPIILWIFWGWKFALVSFVLGLIINNASRKTASQFVCQNMLEDEAFCSYVLLHGGATIEDAKGNQISFEMVKQAELLKMMRDAKSPR